MARSSFCIFPPLIITLIIVSLAFSSCDSDSYTPKPRGYFRIALPERKYQKLDSIYPYAFEYPVYALVRQDPFAPDEKNWINLEFPSFRGRIHLSYKQVENKDELRSFEEDARTMALKHMSKASSIRQKAVLYPESKVYGLIYDIKGLGAASPYQFYLTDSTRHFIRGALYFDAVPNSDSLMPVIDFVKADIDHLVSTLHWK